MVTSQTVDRKLHYTESEDHDLDCTSTKIKSNGQAVMRSGKGQTEDGRLLKHPTAHIPCRYASLRAAKNNKALVITTCHLEFL